MKNKTALLVMLLIVIHTALSADTKFITYITQVKGFTSNHINYYEQNIYVNNESFVRIYSLTNPWSPRIEAEFVSTSPITDIVNLEPNRFYVCSPEPSTRISEIDSMNTFGKILFAEPLCCFKADREGAMLYTADNNRGLEIYDLGKGLVPAKTATYSEKWGIRDVVVHYPRIHALNNYGYVNIDVSDSAFPVEAGRNYEVVDGNILCVNNSIAWIGAGSTLVAMDFTDPKHPILINRYRFNYDITALVAKDRELFVGLENSGLKILNIANPNRITETNSYFVKTGVSDIALNGEFIYLAAGRLGWIILKYY